MKKLHKLIILSYIRPFVATFFIVSFILLMLFLFKYIDELVGKGLEWNLIVELLFYVTATNVPLALPLSILLSSIMTFGNLGEKYELVAIKASGISLSRAMMPLITLMLFICVGAFYFSNVVMPEAYLKMGALLYDVRQKKAALSIPEGIFYNDIDGYTIRVDKKDKKTGRLHGVMIYDHSEGMGNTNVLLAEEGIMRKTKDGRFLILELKDGVRYSDIDSYGGYNPHDRFLRAKFRTYELQFDLSAFNFTRRPEELFRDNYQLFNVKQLLRREDSLKKEIHKDYLKTAVFVKNKFAVFRDRKLLDECKPLLIPDTCLQDFLSIFHETRRSRALDYTIENMRSAKSYIDSYSRSDENSNKFLRRHIVEYHRKYTLSFACMVLFFIGAPMGAIVRKGGFGMPVIISIIFFIIFHVLSITGEKFAKEGKWTPVEGMWFATAVLVPIGVFLTWKAASDSAIFDVDKYRIYFDKFGKFLKKSK